MKTPERSSDDWESVADILRRTLALDALLAEANELIEQPARPDDEAKA